MTSGCEKAHHTFQLTINNEQWTIQDVLHRKIFIYRYIANFNMKINKGLIHPIDNFKLLIVN
jgi:hypothetical protein